MTDWQPIGEFARVARADAKASIAEPLVFTIERDLLRPGIFPLQAWTEIILPVTAPPQSGNDQPTMTGLTGMMPLHWTRAHKRRVHGVWTLISDYWSGDGSLGIKQSRYTVTP